MKKSFLLLMLFTVSNALRAEEGMWIPLLLQEQNEANMQRLGMRMTAEQIYSINHSSMKEGIVLFGGGCTAEIVSAQGLILTNHHCGFSQIQSHSTLEKDYLRDGFWAMRKEEELPCQGLTVEMLIRMEDVTLRVLEGVNSSMNESQRDSIIEVNSAKIIKEATAANHYTAKVKSFFYGNEFYLMVSEVFKDIRLVGAPPITIGNFGGDTDNWVWPRHTGDFSVFRIYTGKDGHPAVYSKDNVPYVPGFHFTISLAGYKEGDFTLVYGYPGRTQEYIPSWGLELITRVENPIRIDLRDKRLEVIKREMQTDRKIRLQYASKAANIANGWKKWQGESRGITRMNVIALKKEQEIEFQTWAFSQAANKAKFGSLLDEFRRTYEALTPLDIASVYYTEAALGSEIIRFANRFTRLIEMSSNRKANKEDVDKLARQLMEGLPSFYKDYNALIDREITPFLLREYYQNVPSPYRPEILNNIAARYKGDFEKYAGKLFSESMLLDEKSLTAYLRDFKARDYKRLANDPVYLLSAKLGDAFTALSPSVSSCRDKLDSLQRIYMDGLREMSPGKQFYPDANLSLRVAYGKVGSYEAADAVTFNYFTTIDGLLQKEDTSITDYRVNERLKELVQKKDFGIYADTVDQTIHTCFIAANHTSGGNSGSPVINADGQLIGINFDRCWEGTMSDLAYNPDICRNISLDIRYCLFVIDKICGARHLVEEMTLVK